MPSTHPSVLSRLWIAARSRSIATLLVVCLLVMFSHVLGTVYLSALEGEWETVSEEASSVYLAAAATEFSTLQRTTRSLAAEISQNAVLQQTLEGVAASRQALFAEISRFSRRHDVGLEVYDRNGVLVAWEGTSGPVRAGDIRQALAGQMISYVERTPIAAYLFVVTPVRTFARVEGAVLVRRPVEVTYPLSNTFIQREGLSDRLLNDLGIDVEFDFRPEASVRMDGRYRSQPLYGIDSARIGVVSVMRPIRAGYLEGVALMFDRIESGLLALLVISLTWVGATRLLRWRLSSFWRVLGLSAVLWLGRYGLLWAGFPSVVFSGGPFDPEPFASQFGGGIARSAADLTVTTVVLVLNLYLAGRVLLGRLVALRRWPVPSSALLGWLLAAVSAASLPLLLRGFAAVVRSAVFDSSIRYNDPSLLVPSMAHGLLLVNLLVLAWCLILLMILAASYLIAWCSDTVGMRFRRIAPGVALLAAMLVSLLFGRIHPTPLIPDGPREVLLALAFLGGMWLTASLARRSPPLRPRVVVGTAVGAVVLLFPLLEHFTELRDKDRIEALAASLLRPVDGWLTVVVDEALRGFLTDDVLDQIEVGSGEDLQRVAFQQWARSAVSKEGYQCEFILLDPKGEILSRFSVGGSAPPGWQNRGGGVSQPGSLVRVGEVGTGPQAVKVYSAEVNLVRGGTILGTARVAVAAGQQALFRGESPAILRTSGETEVVGSSRSVILSEYRNGILFTTSSEGTLLRRKLPEMVVAKETWREPIWMAEELDDRPYQTVYMTEAGWNGRVVAVSVEQLSLLLRLSNFIRLMIYALVVLLLIACVFALVARYRGRSYRFTFRDRLLTALILTSLAPLVVTAWYGQMAAMERILEATSQRLEQETASLLFVLRDAGRSDGFIALEPGEAEELAGRMGLDFNIYSGQSLAATSRPELYDAGILDRRLSGEAYLQLYLRGRQFALQTETVGKYRYAVGYRPIADSDGTVEGVLSVPTLYRQDRIDEEMAQRNAVLFALFAAVGLVVLAVATSLANRIARPVHRLTEATRRVSAGDLDVSLSSVRADGEIGTLVRSFQDMMHELKRSREQLAKAERELAWQEMAKQVAHEIKNPLTPMKLTLQHLRQALSDGVENFRQIFDDGSRMMIEQIDTLGRIASEFSRFARMPSRVTAPCDVHALLNAVVELYSHHENIRWEKRFAALEAEVLADKEELARAFSNIMGNAVQAMPGGGTVTVSTGIAGNGLWIDISDTGTGITAEILPRLFEPNFSTKTDGMGLGLAIVKRTIEEMRGTITVESTLEVGTTFRIRLPLKPAGYE